MNFEQLVNFKYSLLAFNISPNVVKNLSLIGSPISKCSITKQVLGKFRAGHLLESFAKFGV